jgi:hypothetical protein
MFYSRCPVNLQMVAVVGEGWLMYPRYPNSMVGVTSPFILTILKLVKSALVVEKGIKAVSPVNFSDCGK